LKYQQYLCSMLTYRSCLWAVQSTVACVPNVTLNGQEHCRLRTERVLEPPGALPLAYRVCPWVVRSTDAYVPSVSLSRQEHCCLRTECVLEPSGTLSLMYRTCPWTVRNTVAYVPNVSLSRQEHCRLRTERVLGPSGTLSLTYRTCPWTVRKTVAYVPRTLHELYVLWEHLHRLCAFTPRVFDLDLYLSKVCSFATTCTPYLLVPTTFEPLGTNIPICSFAIKRNNLYIERASTPR
jgi:hypothetical protein